MSPGSIALARVQQADGRLKTRPVMILTTMPPFFDYLVCALSPKLQHDQTLHRTAGAAGELRRSASEWVRSPAFPQMIKR